MKSSNKSTNSQRKLIIENILIKMAAIILIGCAVYEPFYRAMVVVLLMLIIARV